MIIVHTFGPAWNTADLSPFSVKLQTWLKMAGLPYTTEVGNVRKMPQGKLPAISLDGQLWVDSALIIERLSAVHNDPLNEAGWTSSERAVGRAMCALFETDLYFVGLATRWGSDNSFRILKPQMIDYLGQLGMPAWMATMVLPSIRRATVSQMRAQGIGRRNPEEINRLGIGAWTAISDYLADKACMLGERPSALDATAFAFLHTLLVPPFDSEVKTFVGTRTNLVTYHDRMRQQYWPQLAGS